MFKRTLFTLTIILVSLNIKAQSTFMNMHILI